MKANIQEDIIHIYDTQIALLELLLSDMSGVSLNDVEKWIEDTNRQVCNLKVKINEN